MKIEIVRSGKSGKWVALVDYKVITEQKSLSKCVFKLYKYVKSQGE